MTARPAPLRILPFRADLPPLRLLRRVNSIVLSPLPIYGFLASMDILALWKTEPGWTNSYNGDDRGEGREKGYDYTAGNDFFIP